MKSNKNKADIMREARKKQLLEFIEKKRTKVLHPKSMDKSPLREDKKVQAPYIKKEERPKEAEKVYINGSNRRKKRREKLAEVFAKREELKKKRALAIQQEKQKNSGTQGRRKEAEEIRVFEGSGRCQT